MQAWGLCIVQAWGLYLHCVGLGIVQCVGLGTVQCVGPGTIHSKLIVYCWTNCSLEVQTYWELIVVTLELIIVTWQSHWS